jgi:hypothetical protein
MRSVADALRRESVERLLALDPGARLSLALRLGIEDAHLLSTTRRISVHEAERIISGTRAHGRVHSIVNHIDAP